MTLLDRARQIATGSPPRPELPTEIQPDELEPADPPEVRGNRYFRHKRWGILRPRAELVPETIDWPALPFVEEERDDNGTRWARIYEIVAPDAWQRISKPQPVRATDRPAVPVDALRTLATFRPDPEVMIPGWKREVDLFDRDSVEFAARNRDATSRLVNGRPRATTPAAMIERFDRKGITLRLAPDGRLVAHSTDGRVSDYEREALRRAAPLLAAHISGTPLRCAWCPAHAATLLDPESVPACTEHAQ